MIIPSLNELVFLFMIISGYGMCNGYLNKFKSRQMDLETFYIRRYRKIIPFFAVLIMLDILINRTFVSFAEGFIELTGVFGLLPRNELSVIGVSWTLGVIFVFYLLFPFFAFLLYSKRRAWFSFVIAIAIQVLCVVYFMTEKFVEVGYACKTNFLFCAPHFLVGGLIYLYKEQLIVIIKKYRWITLLVCGAVTILYYLIPHKLLGYSVKEFEVLFVYTLWTIYAVCINSRWMYSKVIQYIGSISMEIYLSHMMFFRIVEKVGLIRWTEWFGFGITLISVILLLIFAIPIMNYCIKIVANVLIRAKILLGGNDEDSTG